MGSFDIEHILHQKGTPDMRSLANIPEYKPRNIPYFSTKQPSSFLDVKNSHDIGRTLSTGVGDAIQVYETKRKPSRSVFAPSQIGLMEDIYHGKNKTYLTADYRKDIAKKTGLSETQVKRWWQNRRQKDKNRVRDSLQTLNNYLPSMMLCERSRNIYQPSHHSVNDSMNQLTRTHFLLQQTNNQGLVTRT